MPSLDFIIILLIIVIVLLLISLNTDQIILKPFENSNPNIVLNLNGNKNYDISINDKENFENVAYPSSDNILRYNDVKKCGIYEKPEIPIVKSLAEKTENSCQNETIYNNHTYRILKDNKQLPLESCVYSYGNNSGDFDYGKFYRNKIVIHKSYLEDPKTRGHNLHDFDQYAGIYEIGRIPIEKNVKHPVPYRYAFTL